MTVLLESSGFGWSDGCGGERAASHGERDEHAGPLIAIVTGGGDPRRVQDGDPEEKHCGEHVSGEARADARGDASAAQIKQRPTKLAKKNRPGIQVGMRVEMKNAYLKCRMPKMTSGTA